LLSEVEIFPFEEKDAAAFRALNEEWIVRYFEMEESDHKALGDPMTHIIGRGGRIYMAWHNAKPIGCCAVMPMRPGVFEVGKMAVAPEYRGYGVGRRLLQHVIEEAKRLGANSLFLGSNTSLPNALHLYESMGFQQLADANVPDYPYARANIFMQKEL